MRVGIVTFPKAINYGTALQAAALRKVLLKHNIDAVFPIHKCDAIEASNKVFDFKSALNIKYTLAHLINLPYAIRRTASFKDFQSKYMAFSDGNLQQFDAVIAGSDQIWNYNLTNGDLYYFLDFPKGDTKKISYAGSFGLSKIDPVYYSDICRTLSDFNAISVREKRAKELIEEIANLKSQVVLDPTLLLTADEWSDLATSDYQGKGPYIFVYTVFRSKSLWDFAINLSRQTGMPIRTISYSRLNRHPAEYDFSAGPSQWLSAVKNADYVITNSFHGVAFSINFQKQFFFEMPPASFDVGSRLQDITERYNFAHRELKVANTKENIDYAGISSVLCEDRKISEDFLREALYNG